MLGDRGRLVIPSELRERLDLRAGAALIIFETPQGMVLATRDQAKELVRAGLRGLDLVDELVADRRAVAAAEDVA